MSLLYLLNVFCMLYEFKYDGHPVLRSARCLVCFFVTTDVDGEGELLYKLSLDKVAQWLADKVRKYMRGYP